MLHEGDTKFLDRLSGLEDFLLDSLIDQSKLSTFITEWESLLNDLTRAIDSAALSPSTISLANKLSDKVSDTLASLAEIDELPGQVESSPPTLSEDDAPKPVSTKPKHGIPSYISPSYKWLRNNLHKPYPSAEIRDAIAAASGAPRKDVDNWFIDVRKRIGVVHAASIFFGLADGGALEPEAELEFGAILSRAQELYRGKIVADDIFEDITKMIGSSTSRQKQQTSAGVTSYPSPPLSPSAGGADAGRERSTSPSRKRSISRADREESNEPACTRPSKRPRRSPIPLRSLPSPQSESTSPVTPAFQSTSPQRGNKRAFAEEEDEHSQPSPKRHCPTSNESLDVSPVPAPTGDLLFENWFEKSLDASDVGLQWPATSDLQVAVELGSFDQWVLDTPDYHATNQTSEGYSLAPLESSLNSDCLFNLEGWERLDSSVPLPSYTASNNDQTTAIPSDGNLYESINLLPDYTEMPPLPSTNPPDYLLPQSLPISTRHQELHEPLHFRNAGDTHEEGANLMLGHFFSNHALQAPAITTSTLPRHEKEWLLWQMKQATQRLEEELATSRSQV